MSPLRTILLAGAIFFVSCSVSLDAVAAHCGPAGSTSFMLACRGPLDYRISWEVGAPPSEVDNITTDWVFNANPEPAGATGESLQRGSCAWEDRVVYNTEPHVFRTQVTKLVGRQIFHQSLVACNADSGCVFVICVTSNGQVLLHYATAIDIKFPAGLKP